MRARRKTFQPAEWQHYRDLRLRALRDPPDAFGATFEQASRMPESAWLERLERTSIDRDLPLAAVVGREFAGMAWAAIDAARDEHAHLYQMWVAPGFRRRGVGRKLLETALAWAQARGAAALVLQVTCGETPARKLYEAAGFDPVGEPAALRPGSQLQVQSMIFKFRDAGWV